VDSDILQSGRDLLDLMGVPWIQAPSEGEAHCAWLCRRRLVCATASQDFDSLLFGSPRLVCNLSSGGERKLPGRQEYITVRPELIELHEVLTSFGPNRNQLIVVALLVGTDYNKGMPGIGPKKALELVQEQRTLRNVLASVDFAGDVDVRQVNDCFLNPPHTDEVPLQRRRPDGKGLLEFLVAEYDFSPERMEKAVQRLAAICRSRCPDKGSNSAGELL
jgi:flap endonuclease-1